MNPLTLSISNRSKWPAIIIIIIQTRWFLYKHHLAPQNKKSQLHINDRLVKKLRTVLNGLNGSSFETEYIDTVIRVLGNFTTKISISSDLYNIRSIKIVL